jgi:hypothetical protein
MFVDLFPAKILFDIEYSKSDILMRNSKFFNKVQRGQIDSFMPLALDLFEFLYINTS